MIQRNRLVSDPLIQTPCEANCKGSKAKALFPKLLQGTVGYCHRGNVNGHLSIYAGIMERCRRYPALVKVDWVYTSKQNLYVR